VRVAAVQEGEAVASFVKDIGVADETEVAFSERE
jgi:hypothetical protein